MALATQCPHCHTTFRVAHDQLKLRAGLVRCGACKHIFNGIENLLRPDEPDAASFKATPAPSSDAAVDAAPHPGPASPASTPVAEAPPASFIAPAAEPVDTPSPQDEATQHVVQEVKETSSEPTPDPLLRMTLMDFSHEQPATSDNTEPARSATDTGSEATDSTPDESHDPLEEAIDELQRKPLRRAGKGRGEDSGTDALDEVDDANYVEPSFVRQGRRRQRLGQAFEIVMILGSVILLLALAAQMTYAFRSQIAARFPQTRQALNNACSRLGCQVGLPTRIDAVAIESNELQAIAPERNLFSLNVLLRNHAATTQAWPSIELTLNDASDKAIARRVFGPRDYLPSAELSKGFGPNAEQQVKLTFELAQLKAAGYRVYLFYP